MFSKLLVLFGLLAVSLSAALQDPVPIISQINDLNPDGSFQWSYQSGDGSSQQQSGENKQLGHDKGEVIRGAASWVDPAGGHHELTYLADEFGYHPQSADLPVGPPIPAAIARALDWIASRSNNLRKQK